MLILQREIKWDGKSKAHEQIKKNPFMAEQNGYDPVIAEMDVRTWESTVLQLEWEKERRCMTS
jgi:hypothetical protein